METEDPLQTLEAKIAKLKEEKESLLKQEKYSEADNVQNELTNLTSFYKKKKLEHLKMGQYNERDILERELTEETRTFNKTWDALIEAYEKKCESEIQEFKKKKKEDVVVERSRLEKTLHIYFKPSSALLNMIKCKEKAAKAGKYADAQILANQIDQARDFEQARFEDQRRAAVDQGLLNFLQNYDKKFLNLIKRHQTGLNELQIQRLAEFDVLSKKYENLKREMENSHEISRNILMGKHTTAAGRHHQSPNKALYSTSSSLNPMNTNRRTDE